MNIGFIGAGRIANTLASTMARMEDVNLYAIASRDLGRAQAFAAQYGFDKAYGSYTELLQDPNVELVYIATPHSHHAEHMKLCIEHGKNVLCEKAFTLNAAQARQIAALAKAKGVYVAEAIWTRYMPSRAMINEVLASGIIGNVTALTATLCYPVAYKERCIRPELAGGALLDVGVYCLNFALMHFGDDIERMDSSVRMTDTGVDGQESITLHYRDGRIAVLTAGILSRSDRKGIFYGDKGYIIVENINNPQSISVYDLTDTLVKKIQVPAQITGYEYQIREAMARIRAGETESASMPLDTTIAVMERMDALRKDWGLIYPMEQ
jgi:predicted dehydrogenase